VAILIAATASAEELPSMDEPLPYDDLIPAGRASLSLGCTEKGGRLRGEWLGGGLHILGDLRPGPAGLRCLGAVDRSGFRLELGYVGSSEGLLGLERRRPHLISMPRPGLKERGISLGTGGAGGRLVWRGGHSKLALGWDDRRGSRLELLRGPLRLDLFPGRGGEGGAVGLGHLAGGGEASVGLEIAAAGAALSRKGLRLVAAAPLGPLDLGLEGLLVEGPRPGLWSRLGWIGSEGGGESRIAAAWENGPLRLRAASRWREGIGLSAGRQRREFQISAALRGEGLWKLEFRRRADRDWDTQLAGSAFPLWESSEQSRWETRLSFAERSRWMAVLRSGGEDVSSLLLRLEPAEKELRSGLGLRGRLDLFRTPESDSFRFVRGDALSRRSRALRGRGCALAVTLRWRHGCLEARMDADAGSQLAPAAGLSLHWRPAN